MDNFHSYLENLGTSTQNKKYQFQQPQITIENPDTPELTAFTDGSSINNGQEKSKAGYGVYFGPNDHRNVSRPVP